MTEPRLPTRAQYDDAAPFEQGYMAYTFSHWEGSEIPSEANCPYERGTRSHDQFQDGVNAAVLEASEVDDG